MIQYQETHINTDKKCNNILKIMIIYVELMQEVDIISTYILQPNKFNQFDMQDFYHLFIVSLISNKYHKLTSATSKIISKDYKYVNTLHEKYKIKTAIKS